MLLFDNLGDIYEERRVIRVSGGFPTAVIKAHPRQRIVFLFVGEHRPAQR